jgi:hypothetical protein
MKASSRVRYLIAGVALILLTNVIALGGVAYNRSGNPESALKLTQRELGDPYKLGLRNENSGMDLILQWRVLNEGENITPYAVGVSIGNFGGSPKWLDEAKLADLGFDVLKLENRRKDSIRFNPRLSKEVLLVLEFSGKAYQRTIEIARQSVAKEEALALANPGKKEFEQRAKMAQSRLEYEENKSSRLFVIDAGTDLGTLRAKYPDNAHYAIVHGLIQPEIDERGMRPKISGYISHLSVASINVPLELRQAFKSNQQDKQFDAVVAFC